jgi:predicted Zn-dependent protease
LAATSKRDKNPEEALMFVRKALDAQPDLAAACQVAGEALMSLNRADESERLLLYGALLGDDDPNLLANIASIAAQKGHGRLASVILNRVLAQAPEHEVSKKNRETLHDQVTQGRYKFRPLV